MNGFFGEESQSILNCSMKNKNQYGIIIEKWIVFFSHLVLNFFSISFAVFIIEFHFHTKYFPINLVQISTEHFFYNIPSTFCSLNSILYIFPTYLQDINLEEIFVQIQQIIVCTYSVFFYFFYVLLSCDCTNAVAERSVL